MEEECTEARLEDALTLLDRKQDAIESLLTIISQMGGEHPLYRRLLAKTDERGKTTLHIACEHSNSDEIIKQISLLYPDANNDQTIDFDHADITPLCYALARNDLPLDLYETLVDQYPEDGVRNNNTTTLLHDACKHGAPEDVFRLLLRRFPETASFKDHFQDTPLHEACHYRNVSVKTIELLIDACPDNLTHYNQDHDTPLGMACYNGDRELSIEMLKLLINRGRQALEMKDIDGNYPLHDFCTEGGGQSLFPLALEGYPEATRKSNNDGQTPLHYACFNVYFTLKELCCLVDRFPVACLFSSIFHCIPYDWVVSSRREALEKKAVLDYIWNATTDAVCAMIECVLHPNSSSTSSLSVIQHLRETITAALPGLRDLMDSMSSLGLAESIRLHLDQDMLQSLLRNEDLQKLLKEDEDFQNLVTSVSHMNESDRTYHHDDPMDKLKGMCVLTTSLDTVDCLFLHLRENPALCDRSFSVRASRKRKTRP
jgi:ankyrin repeat protein